VGIITGEGFVLRSLDGLTVGDIVGVCIVAIDGYADLLVEGSIV